MNRDTEILVKHSPLIERAGNVKSVADHANLTRRVAAKTLEHHQTSSPASTLTEYESLNDPKSPGRPLERSTRALMKQRFGHDFGNVRIHTDSEADRSAQSIQSLAYTFGKDILFRQGFYSPATSLGQKLIAHELAHVTQQTASPDRTTLQPEQESELEAEAVAASSVFESSDDRIKISHRSQRRISRQEAPAEALSASREVIKIEESIAAIEAWQMDLAGAVSDSNAAVKIGAFIPFFFLDLMKRAVQLGNILFGITELQNAADVIVNSGKSLAERTKAALWALFLTAMNLLMIGGIAEKVGLQISSWVARFGKVGWVKALRGSAASFIEDSIHIAKENLPGIVEMMNWISSSAKSVLSWSLSKVTGSGVWQKMIEWSKTEIRLPGFVEALSEDLVVVMRRLMGKEVPGMGTKAGLGTQIYQDVKLAGQAQELTRAQKAGELPGLTSSVKGDVGEQAGRLVTRLTGMKLTPDDISKLPSNQGIDQLLVKSQKPFVPVALEAKATSSQGATLSLLSNRTVKAGDPLAQFGVPVGTRVRQASRGFNVSRLLKLAQTGDPEKVAAANALLQNLARMDDMVSITRLQSGTVELYRLDMTPDLLQISAMNEVLTVTFGEIKQSYYILVAAEVGPLATKAGVTLTEE